MAYTSLPSRVTGQPLPQSYLDLLDGNLDDHESRIVTLEASGTGDVVGPSSSIADEVVLFDGTTGKLIKRSSLTATVVKSAAGVLSAAVAGTDYVTPGGAETLTSKTLTSPVLTSPVIGTGGPALRSATLTLTDAQIKALPTTPISFITAPGTGRRIIPVKGQWRADTSAGAYTNIDATLAKLRLVYGATVALASAEVMDDGAPGAFTSLLGGAAVKSVGLHYWDEDPVAVSSVENAAVQVSIDNSASGNLTGGNAANSLRVTLLFLDVPSS